MNVNGPGVDATLENRNGSCVDVTLGNGNAPYVDVILVNGNDLGMDGNRTDWIPPHIDFPHYQPPFLGHLGPFFGAYLSPLTPNLSLVYVATLALHLSRQIARTPRHLIMFGVFDMTPFQDQTVPLLAHTPYPYVFYVFSLARWIPEKTPQIRFQRGLPNVFQTFSCA